MSCLPYRLFFGTCLQEEKRAHSTKYYFTADGPGASTTSDPLTIAANIEDTRGKKRARAEDFL